VLWTEERVVAFIDILGFTHLVEQASAGNRSALGQALEGVFRLKSPDFGASNSQWRMPGKDEYYNYDYNSWREYETDLQISGFSDNIAISAKGEDALNLIVFEAGYLAASLLQQGLLCRGGIARNWLVHRQVYTVGSALLQALELEKKANYPRILLAENVAKEVISNTITAFKWIWKDEDVWYIDIFEFMPKAVLNDYGWQSMADETEKLRQLALSPLEDNVYKGVMAILKKGLRMAATQSRRDKWNWLIKQLRYSEQRRYDRVKYFEAQSSNSNQS
jgi:hypothetical protein